jgi:competence protein ComEC
LIVQLWLLPLLIIYFHRVSVASIFLSVFVGVIMAVESFAALFAVLLAQVADVFAAPFVWLTEGLNWVVLHVADPFVKYGWASFRVPVYSRSSAIVYAIYFIPLTVVTVFLNKWSPFTARVTSRSSDTRAFLIKTSMAALALLVAALVFHPFSAPKPDGRLRVEFLDVGQGDAIFITAPDGQTMLIDGGGRPNYGKLKVQKEGEEAEFFEPDVREVGESVVSEFLWERGHDRIDYLIATHADADHIQGLGNVAENFEVSTVFVARSPDEDQNFKDFEDVVKTRSIPMNFLSAGEVFDLGGARVEVVFPFAGPSQPGVSNNNESMVIKITFGERSFLLTGDIEKEAEASLLRGPVDIAADVVKIAHHGSKTSSTGEFIKASRARIAVISVGRTSPFDHPNQQVVEAWKASGARVLTTGENGTISFSTDGKDLQMQTFTGNNIYR